MENFKYILILLSCSVVFITICRKLRLPPIIGYLSVGILVGPGGLKLLPSIEDMHFLAEFGVVFLMFTLGLEFSIPRLMANRRILLGMGGMQVAICTLVAAVIAYYFSNIELRQAFLIGGGLALSSTAVVIKQLYEQKEQNTNHGRKAINILLFQDIAAVIFLIIIPALTGDNSKTLHITFLITIAKGIGVCVALASVGLWVLRPLFHVVARAHSTELFMIATLLVALSAAGITHFVGLSFALGAFLAGMMLGETEFRHQIELDIRPFRDVLLGLFFVVIGAYLEITALSSMWREVAIILVGLFVLKAILITSIIKLFSKADLSCAVRTAIILSHGGEFGFVILTEAISKNILSAEQKPAIFAAIVLSVMISPILIRFHGTIANFILREKEKDIGKEFPTHQLSSHAADLSSHVIICGYGRVGQILARFLEQENIPWLALDLDPMRITKAATAGEHSFYGDATHPEILSAAGLSKSRMVVITFADESSSLDVLNHVRSMRLDLPVFVRTRDDSNIDELQNAGATEVVPESLEGSIMLASHLLLTLGVPTSKVISKVRRIHSDRYDILRGIYTGINDNPTIEDLSGARRSLHTIFISEAASVVGSKLGELLLEDEEMSIKTLTRDNTKYQEPDPEMIIEAGDAIVLFSTPEETTILEERIFQGIEQPKED